MGRPLLVDTNAIIDLFHGRLPASGAEWLNDVLNNENYHLSAINKIELLGFSGTVEEEVFVEAVVENAILSSLNDEIIKGTVAIKKASKIKLPDAVIAATALHYDLTIVTRNTKDFSRIAGVRMINPHEK